jgi:hypothetical protein
VAESLEGWVSKSLVGWPTKLLEGWVAKSERDGWLSCRGMGGYWLCRRGIGGSVGEGWVAKSVARQYSSAHSSTIINGRHKRRSGRHTLARQKNIQKKFEEISNKYNFSDIFST